MGIVKRDHELVESSAYPYGFSPEVNAWIEVAEDRDSELSASIYIEALELGEDLDSPANLAGEPDMEDLVSSLLGLSLSSIPNPTVSFSSIIPTLGALKTLSIVSTGRNGRSVDRRSKGVLPALSSLLGEGEKCTSDNVLGVATPLAAQQQFRS
ncbi:hypothetical protein AYI68_g3449, partial [Smittium mucronatum]